MFKKVAISPAQPRRAKTHLSTGKAAGLLARGAYTEYVSTTKARERRWRPFSAFTEKDRKIWPNPAPP